MNSATEACSTAAVFPLPANTAACSEDGLRERLKRCPPATYEAARQFRLTGETRHVPTIILGIIERFTESGLRQKLRNPPDTLRLGEDLGLDSLTLMEIVLLVEEVFAISIKNEELQPLRTLGDIRQFIEIKLQAKPFEAERTG